MSIDIVEILVDEIRRAQVEHAAALEARESADRAVARTRLVLDGLKLRLSELV